MNNRFDLAPGPGSERTIPLPWHDGLNEGGHVHRIASDATEFVRVVAGPGTGKSFALKRRVARLLEEGTPPARILPVTFTNVAAEDLQREMLRVGVPGCEEIRGSTLHSLGMRVLGQRHVLEATGRVVRPLNRFEMEPLLYDLSNEFGDKRRRASRIRAYEAAWARLQHEDPGHALDPEDRRFEAALATWLRFHEGMLIGEIIPELYGYLRDNPAAPERQLYDHVLVDEYQDLNRAEQAVIDLLRGQARLCIVGDDDQSIYSFKFAHPAGIRTFPETHAPAADHEILECRRCPTRVVDMANSLIGHNIDRDARQLTPRHENGEGQVQIIQFGTLAQEADGIAQFVQDQILNHGYQPQDILILAQRRSIGNPLHAALLAHGIPSKSYYQEGELDSISAQERMALLKLHINPEDRVALRWLLGHGSPDFRRRSYSRIRAYCEQSGMSPWSVMLQLEAGPLTLPHTRPLVARFQEIRNTLATLQDADGMEAFVAQWLPEDVVGLGELRELALGLVPLAETPDELLTVLIDAISTPEIPPDVTDVRIMSLHKSKGLSSPVVIIAGCVEGLLPTAPDTDLTAVEQRAALEEQRRLLYVGLTRVKAEPEHNWPGILVLTYSRVMSLADAMQSGIRPAFVRYGNAHVNASRFIQELGPRTPVPRAG